MKILILGGSGMLGHKLYQQLSLKFETYVTLRNYIKELDELNIYKNNHIRTNIDAFNFEEVKNIILNLKPQVVINCIGIIKQLKEAKNQKISIYINSFFPHLLSELCQHYNTRLIHISTDCVFSGNKGNYSEVDISDAQDLYGRTKYLGEVGSGKSLTLRTSIIGHELFSNISLVDWFISNKANVVKGYTNAFYTGFPTITLAKELVRIIKEFPQLNGIYNLSSEKISKYQLLEIIKKVYSIDKEIIPFGEFNCDRSLDSAVYRKLTGFLPSTWLAMIEEMHVDYLDNKRKGIYNV